MLIVHPQYITSTSGEKMVVLPGSEFDSIIAELEELDDIRLYDESKLDDGPSIPMDEAFKMIEANRQTKK